MTGHELEDLRGAWARAVKVSDGGRDSHYRHRANECWFCGAGFAGPCEGWIEGAHWIKRQHVERWVRTQTGDEELVTLAAWDPRNGVAARETHHHRFDSHLMPPLVVPYELVPDHVLEFAADYGLETYLEDHHPKGT